MRNTNNKNMELRMIYEHLMRDAFQVETRKKYYFTDADYFDGRLEPTKRTTQMKWYVKSYGI